MLCVVCFIFLLFVFHCVGVVVDMLCCCCLVQVLFMCFVLPGVGLFVSECCLSSDCCVGYVVF